MALAGTFTCLSSSFLTLRDGLLVICAALRHISSKTIAILLKRSSTAINPRSLFSLAFSCCRWWSCLSSCWSWVCWDWYCWAMPSSCCRFALSLLIFSSSWRLYYSCWSRCCWRLAISMASYCWSVRCSSSSYLLSCYIFSCNYRSSWSLSSMAYYFLRLHYYYLLFCSSIFLMRYSPTRFFYCNCAYSLRLNYSQPNLFYYSCLRIYYYSLLSCQSIALFFYYYFTLYSYSLTLYSYCRLLSPSICFCRKSSYCRLLSFSLAISCSLSYSTRFLSYSRFFSSSASFLASSNSFLRNISSSFSRLSIISLICSSSISSPCGCSSSSNGCLPGVCFCHRPRFMSTANCQKDPTDQIQESS